MKKIALIVALMMLIPCSAFSMQMLNNSSMDQITGQAGVSIAFDDVQIFLHIDKMAYIDSDGVSTTVAPGATTAPGAVGLNNFTINLLNVNAIIGTGTALAGSANANFGNGVQSGSNMALASAGSIPLFYNYATTGTGSSYLTGVGSVSYGLESATYINPETGAHAANIEPRFLTIDVTNDLPAATAATQYLLGSSSISQGGVLIGIPTMEISINNMILTPYYTGAVNGYTTLTNPGGLAVNDFNLNPAYNYGTIQLTGITFTTLSGWVEIAPH